MSAKEGDCSSVDWEETPWEKTPYDGVFIYRIDEEPDPDNPSTPKFTVIAVKVEEGKSIPLHRHNREVGWRENITFPQGGEFEMQIGESLKTVADRARLAVTIKPDEAFGLRNNDSKPLYFRSEMTPGFTGYQEIEYIQ